MASTRSAASTGGAAFSFAVTPQTLLVAGVPLPEEQPVVEAARLLHDRDILSVTFLGNVPQQALHAFLKVLSTQADELRASGVDPNADPDAEPSE